MLKIYEESVTNKIKVQISTLLTKYLKVSSFRFFFKSANINLLCIIGSII